MCSQRLASRSGGQLGLDIVDRGKAKWDRGARQQFKRVHFGVLSTPPKNANCRLEKDFNLNAKVKKQMTTRRFLTYLVKI